MNAHTNGAADGTNLEALERRLAQDLQRLCYPPANWVPPRRHEGRRVLDVVIIGGGMCGLVACFELLRHGIRNLRHFDRSPEGSEGPWVTYARMETLRSPKQLTGPAAGMASLTFRAWFEASFGTEAWEKLGKIPRTMWMDYLRWYRKALDLPVENGVELVRVEPLGDLLKLHLKGADEPFVIARKLVMATGREGLGDAYIPDFARRLPERFWAHSSADIDFAALKGKDVVTIGAGASAMDNAASALEAGCRSMRMLVRRAEMPRINKMMGIGSPGFTCGFPALSPLWRWRFMHYSFATQTPAPRESTLRVSRHPNASFHFRSGIEEVAVENDRLRIVTARGRTFMADFMILGTGFAVDPLARPELGALGREIAVWEDRFEPPAGLENRELGRFPWLAKDFAFTEREPGKAPFLRHIHCFNYGATVSMGKVSGDIPAISEGARWLADSLSANLYAEDVEAHYAALEAYDKPELLGDEWVDVESEAVA